MKKQALKLKPHIVGVIDIGSSAIRMVVMEIQADGSFRRVDRASRALPLGIDVFKTRLLGRETILQAITILSGFEELIRGWGVNPQDVFVIATSAIREAKNRDTFIDRVYIKTGLRIRIVDGVEENHLTYLAVLHAVGDLQATLAKSASLIMEVGGGSTELMIVDRGKMAAAHVFRLGTLRFEYQLGYQPGMAYPDEAVLEEQFHTTIETVKAEFPLARVKYFVMVGGDARTAAAHCGQKVSDHYSIMQREDFLAFMDRVGNYTPEECVKNLKTTYYEAEALIPALQTFKIFLEQTGAQELIVPDVSIREGVILRFALGTDQKAERQYGAQVLASARSLGRKFRYDEKHAVHVTGLCSQLYDQLLTEHGMGRKEKLYLEAGAILHDIGYFVRATGHHKHGAYIVANSEIFGLSIEDISIVAQIVRYHRGSRPTLDQPEYAMLSQDARLIVAKCAAILRVADSLDRSHTQRIGRVSLDLVGNDARIQCDYQGDLSIERHAVSQKAELFEEIYGFRVVLV